MSDSSATVADPAALGLAGFGVTTVILSLINAGLLPGDTMTVVLQLALVYGGGAQLLAGLWEFRNGNTFGGTAFVAFATFWISFYLLLANAASMGKDVGLGIGIYLTMWGVFVLYMFIGSLYTNKAFFLAFLLVLITFILLAISNFSGTSAVLGGWVGLLAGLIALYTSAAVVINGLAGKVVLPVGTAVIKRS